MKRMALIFACATALSATPALARESTRQSRGDLDHRIEVALGQAAAAQQFVADHALMHGKDARGWPCGEPDSKAVAKALKETALALAAPSYRPAASVGRDPIKGRDCDACDDCPDCETCLGDTCDDDARTPRSGIKIDCVDCPDQTRLV